MIHWKRWAQNYQTGATSAQHDSGEYQTPAEYQAELVAHLLEDPLCVGIRPDADWDGITKAAAFAADPDAAWDVLADGLAVRLQPLSDWHGQSQPAPVLWRDVDGPWPDAVLSEGEVAVLSAPGGTGKSYVSLAWAGAAAEARAAGQTHGSACGLRVRSGPVLILSYEDAPVRIAARLRAMGCAAPGDILTLPSPAPLWEQSEGGTSGKGGQWDHLWSALEHGVRPSLVIVDPASAALCGATNDSGPVRRFLDALRQRAEQARVGVLIVAHDTKAARNAAKAGDDPGAGAVAGSAAWHDAARGVLYLQRAPMGGGLLLDCIKANYGRTGWGAMLAESKTPGGKFAGFELDRMLGLNEVQTTRKSWRSNSKRKQSKTKGGSGNAQAILGTV